MSLERRALQVAVATTAVIPISAGLVGAIEGMRGSSAALDSHYRYMSGLLLGIGLVFWSLLRGIERRTWAFRALTFVVVVGGVARLYAYAQRGDPGAMRWALVTELLITPALCLWQARVAAQAAPKVQSTWMP